MSTPPPARHPQLATVLPRHLAERLWQASQHPDPFQRVQAIDAEVHAIQQSHPAYFKETP